MLFVDYIIEYTLRFYCTFLLFFKINNTNFQKKYFLVDFVVVSIGIAFIYYYFKFYISFNLAIIISIFLSYLFLKFLINKSIFNVMPLYLLSYSFSLIFYMFIGFSVVLFISFIIQGNEYPTFIDYRLADLIYLLMIIKICNHRKIKNGISFLKNKVIVNKYKKFLILSCIIILMLTIVFRQLPYFFNDMIKLRTCIFILIIIMSIFMIVWIKKEMDNHYKQKANERTIENLLTMVVEQRAEIKRMTEVSKICHKTNHQMDILRSKIDSSEYSDIKEELNSLSNNYHEEVNRINKKKLLQSTKIDEIDEVLEYVLNEASLNKIDFVIKVNGSINYMIKNFIRKDDLVTMLSDHLKNAIISINNSKNPFRCITLMIGEIGNYYGISIHDTGNQFRVSTLVNLGLKATTTHKKSGGTGIGFITTFETLKKTKGSLVIDEKVPRDYNYTKSVTILFDDLFEYRINSYRKKLINEKNQKNKIVLSNKKTF